MCTKVIRMIVINDMDLPITVADKIINGTKPNTGIGSDLSKAIAKAFTGSEVAGATQDMFSIDEIKEIADYLMVYVNSHPKGD